ncbi:MAG: valine--tRNA ligase, partial [Bacteroidetes bacterium]
DEKYCEQGRNFANKLWNAFRLINGWEVIENLPSFKNLEGLKAAEWFNHKFNQKLAEIEDNYDKYRISDALKGVYSLVWDDFCAWYLEMIKPEFGKPIDKTTYDQTIIYFEKILKIVHPFMPFITEEIWQNLASRPTDASICMAAYPIKSSTPKQEPQGINLSLAFELIQQVRNLRNSKGISPKQTFDIAIKTTDESLYKPYLLIIKKLANIGEVTFVQAKQESAVLLPVNTDEVYAFLNMEVDIEAEKAKIAKEINYLEGFMQSVDAKLNNEKFKANAKPELVEKERQKKADALAKIEVLKNSLAGL